MKIIAVTGHLGAGKDVFSDYVSKKHGYKIVSFRDIVYEHVTSMGLEPTRQNMQNISKDFRDTYGQDYFGKKVVEKIRNLSTNCVVKEPRSKGDITSLKTVGVKFIEIIADESIRFERMKNRKRLSDPTTIEEFRKQQEREKELGYTEFTNYSDIKIENNGSFEEFYKAIDQIIMLIEKDNI